MELKFSILSKTENGESKIKTHMIRHFAELLNKKYSDLKFF